MTFSVFDYYENALLALASYGINLKVKFGSDFRKALEDAGMVSDQATDFATRYTFIDQLENTPNGASATVFKRGNDYIFAIRGTEGLNSQDLLGTDLYEIGTYGIAISQALDIYNYYLRLTAPGGGVSVNQYTYDGHRGISVSVIKPAKGALFGQNITLTGHSLGGHLAVILSRLIPDKVNAVFTYNAPGVDPLSNPSPGAEWFFTNLRALEISTTGKSSIAPNYDISKMSPLVVPEDPIHLLGLVPGVQRNLFSEGQGSLKYHGIPAMTDSLAVHRVISALSPGKSAQEVLALGLTLARAASTTLEASLEALVNPLGDLFQQGAAAKFEDRDALYARANKLVEFLVDPNTGNPKNQSRSISSLVGIDDATLRSYAPNQIAYRYALRELNPFVILGNDAIYDQHNGDHLLDSANFSDQYLKDRAAMLVALIQRNVEDVAPELFSRGNPASFKDRRLSIDFGVATDSPDLLAPNIVFGTDNSDAGPTALIGSSIEDHLYGQGGNDFLSGGAGSDNVESGSGDDIIYGGTASDTDDKAVDTLNGGTGFDIYYAGDGDIIIDADRSATINILYKGTLTSLGGTYRKAAEGVFRNGSDARVVAMKADGAATITIKDFLVNGAFTGGFGITSFPVVSSAVKDPTVPGLHTRHCKRARQRRLVLVGERWSGEGPAGRPDPRD